MKKIVFVLMVILSYGAVQAQGGRREVPTPEIRARHLTEWIDETVKLSPDQKQKVYDINLKHVKQARLTRDSLTGGNRSALRADLRAENQEREAELKAVLSSDQYAAYVAARNQRLKDIRQRRRR